MKILTVLGDSLAMVRPAEGIGEIDLYTFKIQEKFNNKLYVINKAERNNTTMTANSVISEENTLKAANCNFAVIHLGVCDSFPRLFSSKQKKVIGIFSEIPYVNRITSLYIKRKSEKRFELTRKNQICEISLGDFESNMLSLIHKLKKYNPIKHIFIINIVHPGTFLRERSYGILDNVIKYNDTILKVIRNQENSFISLVDLFNYTKINPHTIIASDGCHITKEAHDFIAGTISSELNQIID